LAESNYWLILFIATVVLLGAWLVRRRLSKGDRLQQVLQAIGFDRLDMLVLPDGDDGEIQIDQLILTAKGLLIVDIKDVQGAVFGSDTMQEWTVISADRRYTFANPQAALRDRMAAVHRIVRDVPVAGRLLFLDGAEFTKGTPDLVVNLDGLRAQFEESDEAAARVMVEAFKPHWERLQQHALDR
jgi:hypothetical protein